MAFYTERNDLRIQKKKTYKIDAYQYELLFDCCNKYKIYLAWKYPEECPNGRECCGFDNEKFYQYLRFEIPSLFRRDGIPAVPIVRHGAKDAVDEYDQYALLDYIELFAQDCRNYQKFRYHPTYGHYHLSFFGDSELSDLFREEINRIFTVTGLLYELTKDNIIERVIDDSVVSSELVDEISTIKEPGLKELIDGAIARYRCSDKNASRDAAEKIWDAFERLKTYYKKLDKKTSVKQIITDMANSNQEYIALFDKEFTELTGIGNKFRIRHHETDIIDVPDPQYYDYFFNRCLSLIGLAIKFLK